MERVKTKEIEISIPGGELVFETDGEKAFLSRVAGRPYEALVPEVLSDGSRVVSVGRKAFLGKKQIKSITLPDSVREIGDWAFAYCDLLDEVTMPRTTVGKDIFLGCTRIRKVFFGDRDDTETAALLAKIATDVKASYLVDPEIIGTAEWYEKWDARLISILNEPDSEGFSHQILCGEEDYGSSDQNAYELRRRMDKAEVCMLRAMNDKHLADNLRETINDYIFSHNAGASPGAESWKVILERHPDDREWYEFYVKLSCVNDGNIDNILNDIKDTHPELKAYLLRNTGKKDFLDSLML